MNSGKADFNNQDSTYRDSVEALGGCGGVIKGDFLQALMQRKGKRMNCLSLGEFSSFPGAAIRAC